MKRAQLGQRTEIFLAMLGLALSIGLVWLVPGAQNDFVYDWLSSHTFVHGDDPYRSIGELAADVGLVSSQPLAEIHPRTPGALILQAPIGSIPYDLSYHGGRLLTVSSAYFFAWILARLMRVRTRVAFILAPAFLVIWPFSTVLQFSQSGFLIAALVGWTWLLGERAVAGLPLAAAVCLKLWPWLLVPALWVSGRRRAAVGAAGATLGLNLVGLAFPEVTVSGVIRMLNDAVTFSSSSLASAAGVGSWLAPVLGVALVVVVSRFAANTYAWSVLIALAAAPFVWMHYLPALLVPMALFRYDSARWESLGLQGRPAVAVAPKE